MTTVKFNAVNNTSCVSFKTMKECKDFIEAHNSEHYTMKVSYIEHNDNITSLTDLYKDD